MTDKVLKNNRHLRNDLILIIALLLVAVIGAIYLFCFRAEGTTVTVTVNGEVYGVYSLTDNISQDIITGGTQENLNRLVIKEGKAYIQTATCPDGICAKHRAIYRSGESIICLPHRVVVTVDYKNVGNAPDVVVN